MIQTNILAISAEFPFLLSNHWVVTVAITTMEKIINTNSKYKRDKKGNLREKLLKMGKNFIFKFTVNKK